MPDTLHEGGVSYCAGDRLRVLQSRRVQADIDGGLLAHAAEVSRAKATEGQTQQTALIKHG